MEAFQPILLALLALNLAVFVPLVVRTVRERHGHTRDQQVIEAATPRMLARLAAIAGGPATLEEGTPLEAAALASTEPPAPLSIEPLAKHAAVTPLPAAALVSARPASVVPASRPAPTLAETSGSRRRVWRDASAALVAFACFGLVVVLALPAVGQQAPEPTLAAIIATTAPTSIVAASQPAIALAPSPLPTRIAVVLPTEAPTPTLPLTATPRPTQRVTTAARATPRPTPKPTAKPTPKPTPRPTPKPTPVPSPLARFSWSPAGGSSIAFSDTSKTYGAKVLSRSWDFGDGDSSSAKNVSHTYSDSGCYVVRLTVTTKGGSDTASKQVCL